MAVKKKVNKLKPQDKKLIEEIIRVDHAGEHGATQNYRGQLAIFSENSEFGKEIKEIAEQEDELKKRKIKPQLLKIVKKFREDELEHHDTGIEHQAEMTTGYVLLSKTIKQLCYTAIKISKKY